MLLAPAQLALAPRNPASSGGQARFRIEGHGPLTARTIVPVGDGARALLATRPAAVEQAVRGILELVEHAAGSPQAAAAVRMHGIALASSIADHGDNTVQAHVDDDAKLHASLAKLSPERRRPAFDAWARSERASAGETDANVVAGWLNLGPRVTSALLDAQDGSAAGRACEQELGRLVRVLRHEAQHVADQVDPLLGARAALALREASAEAHSNNLSQLRVARRLLGLDALVGDAALAASLHERPYAAIEQAVAGAVRAAGIAPSSPEAGRLLALPARELGEELVRRIAAAHPDMQDAGDARRALARTLERALDASGG